MKYQNIVTGIFLERPNRFIAICKIGDEIYKCHVKNTGRCRELLIEGTTVFLEKSTNPLRKTPYSLISVQTDSGIINIDSQIPNAIAEEGILSGNIKLPFLNDEIILLKREKTYGKSRFDIYIETATEKVFVEVKGVTLKKGDVAMFPDAPTARGVKHINELITASNDGYKSCILFIIQMEHTTSFSPNNTTAPDFCNVLKLAETSGVNILAYDCNLSENEIFSNKNIPIML